MKTITRPSIPTIKNVHSVLEQHNLYTSAFYWQTYVLNKISVPQKIFILCKNIGTSSPERYWAKKDYLLLAIQCSAGSSRLRNKPWSTDFTLGRWTSCRTNKWDWKRSSKSTDSFKKHMYRIINNFQEIHAGRALFLYLYVLYVCAVVY